MKALRNLLILAALVCGIHSATARGFVVQTADFTPIAAGNSVWLTKSDAGKPMGSLYAQGYAPGWSTMVQWFALSGTRVLWKWEDHQLWFTGYGYTFPIDGSPGMYVCPPSGNRIALQIMTNGGAGTVIYQGPLVAQAGQSLIIPNYGPNSGSLDLPGNLFGQVRFRVVSY